MQLESRTINEFRVCYHADIIILGFPKSTIYICCIYIYMPVYTTHGVYNILICIPAPSTRYSVLERITSGKTLQKLGTAGSSQCFISKKQGQILLMNSR